MRHDETGENCALVRVCACVRRGKSEGNFLRATSLCVTWRNWREPSLGSNLVVRHVETEENVL